MLVPPPGFWRMGIAAAAAGAAGPFQGLRAGRSWTKPEYTNRQSDAMAARPTMSGPTRLSDAQDTEACEASESRAPSPLEAYELDGPRVG